MSSSDVALPAAEPAGETQGHGKITKLRVRTREGMAHHGLPAAALALPGQTTQPSTPGWPLSQPPAASLRPVPQSSAVEVIGHHPKEVLSGANHM